MDRRVGEPGGNAGEWTLLAVTGGTVSLVELFGTALRLSPLLGGHEQDVPWNPVVLSFGLSPAGGLEWTTTASVTLALMIATVLLTVGLLVGAWRRMRGLPLLRTHHSKREDVDARAKWMGRGKQLTALSAKTVRARGAELADPDAAPANPFQQELGIGVGIPVGDERMLYGSYEDLHLDIWGPRQGKTTSRVVPAILEAPGAVITTSNKRDVVDITQAARAERGPVFVFDPQAIAGDNSVGPSWYWDPLTYVLEVGQRQPRKVRPIRSDDPFSAEVEADPLEVAMHPRAADADVRAAQLAAHFADSDDGEDAKKDAFFDPAGEDLLTALLLAAAVDDQPITQVWSWVTNETDKAPARLLDRAGYKLMAHGLMSHYNAAPDQRSGVFGTAQKMCRILKSARLRSWIEPGEGRVPFDPTSFATSTGTLYLLSMEGAGSAGAILNALVEAVLDSATTLAGESGGRLPVPMAAVLDEAANVVRWRRLPQLYSHFGSRGILVMTVLQSWSQGVRCWGREGMKALWATANIRVLGSGVDDVEFLRDRSEAIGDHYEITRSVSKSAAGTSVSRNRSGVRTLTVSDLQALPRGRMVLFGAGIPAVLVRAVPFWARPYAAELAAATEKAKQTAAASAPVTAAQLKAVPDPIDNDTTQDDGMEEGAA